MLEQAAVSTGFKQLPKALGSLWQGASNLISKGDFLRFSEKYKSFLLERYSTIKILGMEEPKPITELYTELRFLRQIPSRQYEPIEKIEEKARSSIQNWKAQKLEQKVSRKLDDEIRERSLASEMAEIQKKWGIKKSDYRAQGGTERDPEYKEMVKDERDEAQTAKRLSKSRPLSPEETEEKSSRFKFEFDVAVSNEIEHQLTKNIRGHSEDLDEEISPSVSADELIRQKPRLLVLGKPGAGKSTLLRHVLLKNLLGDIESPRMPIMVTLREFVDSGHNSLAEYIAADFEDSGFSNPKPFIERIFRKKDAAILLIDGLDEIDTQQQIRVVDEINSLARRYKNLQLIVSCRVAVYRGQLSGFSEYEISDFEFDDIASYAKNWFGINEKLTSDFLKDIKTNTGLGELASTPLLLTLLCISYKRNLKFPEQKALLYLNCLDTIFIDWDSSRQVRRRGFVEHFDAESKKYILGKLACDSFCDGEIIFYKEDLLRRLDVASTALPSAKGTGSEMLREFKENHGIILERSKDIFSFSHLTFHEFFNAFHLSKHPSMEMFTKLIDLFMDEEHWRETLIFLAGLLSRCDDLLLAIEQASRKEILDLSSIERVLVPDIPDIWTLRSGENAEYWEAWLRCRIASYRLGRLSGDCMDPNENAWVVQRLANKIEAIGDLGAGYGQGLSKSKPANRLVAEVLQKTESSNSLKNIGESEQKCWARYFKLVELAADILVSRARCSSDLRKTLLVRFFLPQVTEMSKDTESSKNPLGV